MRVTVSWELCESNGFCMAVAPEVFELGTDDQLSLLLEEPEEGLWARTREAARLCPRGAIRLERDPA